MQKFVMIASLLGLAACGLSQEKFEEDFATKYCEEATLVTLSSTVSSMLLLTTLK